MKCCYGCFLPRAERDPGDGERNGRWLWREKERGGKKKIKEKKLC
jgi:3'-phosphoadenosine 5'-phosphosulfate sulfotransferase (PAPS reductase)/FAD synthetase